MTNVAGERTLRLLTYNFLSGGTQARQAWPHLDQIEPDLLFAQECRVSANAKPRRGLWSAAPGRLWGSGLFLSRGSIRAIEVAGFTGLVTGGLLPRHAWLGDVPLRAFSVHCPAGAGGYVKTMHQLLDTLAPLAAEGDLLLGGDFNVAAGLRGPLDTVRFSPAERMLLERLAEEFELIPCWQTAHPALPLAQTLRWSGNRTTPYHCDGIFAPRRWAKRLARCEVLAGPLWDGLSDHNPVLAEFRATGTRRRRPLLTGS